MKKKILKVLSVILVVAIATGYVWFTSNKTEKVTEVDTFPTSDYTLKTEIINSKLSCYYGGSNEIVYEQPENVIEHIKTLDNCDAVTVLMAWSLVEQTEGVFDFSLYKPIFDAITKANYDLIIVVDAEGRSILKDGQVISTSIPTWVWQKYPNSVAKNFYGEKRAGFDFFSTEHLPSVCKFYDETLKWLGDNYRQDIVGISPGISDEGEVKFCQKGFTWESYTDEAQRLFSLYMQNKYTTVEQMNKKFNVNYVSFNDVKLPVVDYNNSVVSPNKGESFVYTDFMEFREDKVVEYTKNFTDIIRSHNFQSIGYFGQFMFPIDAIYATGVIIKCVDLFDVAVIDYNFYDGYKEQYNAVIPAFLTNLVSNLGYEKVYTGLYFERVSLDGKSDFVNEMNGNIVKDGHSAGIEIGSLVNNTSEKVVFTKPTEIKTEKSKIALYSGEWNFYKTHGEAEEYQNYLIDSVTKLYEQVQFDLNIPVEVISDTNIQKGELKDYELLLLPCQMYVPENSKVAIEEFISNGGKAIQDFRFAEYDSYGKDSNCNAAFGIEQQGSIALETQINSLSEPSYSFKITPQYKNVPVAYSYATKNVNLFNNGVGIKTNNTMVWGFQPQLQYQMTGNKAYLKFIYESIKQFTDV